MIASMKVTEKAQERWDAIVERFRAACILHRNGQEWESRRIVKEELPGLIKLWMALLPPGLKEDAKADLRDMFTREQSIVDQGFKLQRLFRETLVKRIIPHVENRIASKYRSIYAAKLDERNQLATTRGSDGSWVRPSYSPEGPRSEKTAPAFGLGEQRVKLAEISKMIDALQEGESEELAQSILPLEEIVHSLNKAGIDPFLLEG